MVTLDAAAARSKEAGIAHMDRRWWRFQIDCERLDAVEGAVTYIRANDVDALIRAVLAARGGGDAS